VRFAKDPTEGSHIHAGRWRRVAALGVWSGTAARIVQTWHGSLTVDGHIGRPDQRAAERAAKPTNWRKRFMPTVANRRALVVLVALAGMLVATLTAAQQAQAQQLFACVKKSGTARVFTKKPKCKKGETKLSWNTEGLAGKNGLNGVNGVNGKEGGAGAAGKNGAVSGFFATNGKAAFTKVGGEQENVEVLSKTLPAGSYIVAGKVNVTAVQFGSNGEGESALKTYVDARCTLEDAAAGVSDTSYWSGFTNIPAFIIAIGNATLTFDIGFTTTKSSTVTMMCSNISNDGKIESPGHNFVEEASAGAIAAVQTSQNS
jgi:hypothetical protein